MKIGEHMSKRIRKNERGRGMERIGEDWKEQKKRNVCDHGLKGDELADPCGGMRRWNEDTI
jgi:hypothetical protein